jgi:hypothetical protein
MHGNKRRNRGSEFSGKLVMESIIETKAGTSSANNNSQADGR